MASSDSDYFQGQRGDWSFVSESTTEHFRTQMNRANDAFITLRRSSEDQEERIRRLEVSTREIQERIEVLQDHMRAARVAYEQNLAAIGRINARLPAPTQSSRTTYPEPGSGVVTSSACSEASISTRDTAIFDEARSKWCVDNKLHTDKFDKYFDDYTMTEKKKAGSTSDYAREDDQPIAWKFFGRLGSMNVSLGMRPTGKGNLAEKLVRVAAKGKCFWLEWQNGSYASTKMICLNCRAGIDLYHPGLPPEGGMMTMEKKCMKLNNRIAQFMWTEEFIKKYDLRRREYCTVERMNPGSVVRRIEDRRRDESDHSDGEWSEDSC